jgi:hypothetical protein
VVIYLVTSRLTRRPLRDAQIDIFDGDPD